MKRLPYFKKFLFVIADFAVRYRVLKMTSVVKEDF